MLKSQYENPDESIYRQKFIDFLDRHYNASLTEVAKRWGIQREYLNNFKNGKKSLSEKHFALIKCYLDEEDLKLQIIEDYFMKNTKEKEILEQRIKNTRVYFESKGV